MSLTYFKATRPDGTDFRTGTVNYAAALESGETVDHPRKMVRNDPSTYLSVSIVPTDCTGMRCWPCRLFRVEPIGRTLKADVSPNKRSCQALRVVEELPAHLALGPQGEAIAALVERLHKLTPQEAQKMAAAWDAAWDAVWDAVRGAARDAVWDAVRGAARDAAWDAVRGAAWDAVWDAARGAAWDAARDAVLALIAQDLISPEQFEKLYGPWASVMDR